jgi:hypothetical protein
MLTGRADVEYGRELRQIAGTPWSTRTAAGPAGRAALEIYQGAGLIDVMVAQSLAPILLRGACRVARHGRMFCVAWGSLPADGGHVRVEFQSGPLRAPGYWARRSTAVPPVEVGDHFWIATAAGRFDHVTASSPDARHRCPIRRLPAS